MYDGVPGHPTPCDCGYCPSAGGSLPARRRMSLPSNDQLVYTKNLITAALLVVAVPWLLRLIYRDPSTIVKAVGGR